MNTNMFQLMQMLKQSTNPQEFVYNIVEEKMGQNPMFANLLNLAKNDRGAEVEQIARNMMKERGLDFDQEFNNFRKMLGL